MQLAIVRSGWKAKHSAHQLCPRGLTRLVPTLPPRPADPRLTDYDTLLQNLADLRDGKDAQVGKGGRGGADCTGFCSCGLRMPWLPGGRGGRTPQSTSTLRSQPNPHPPDPHLRLQDLAPRGLPPPARARGARGDRGGHLRAVGATAAAHGASRTQPPGRSGHVRAPASAMASKGNSP